MFNSSFGRQISQQIIGCRTKIPVSSGLPVPYINLDNAASTPSCRRSFYKVKEFLQWYSNVHRGSGFKSKLATEVYQQVHQLTAEFLGTDLTDQTVIFTKNTTESINHLAHSLNLSADDVVITSLMEHHSNILPWRKTAEVKYIQLTEDGRLDLNDLETKLDTYQSQTKLVAISGASNVTGYLTPIHKIAELVHQYNTKLLVDGAQLVPHRPVELKERSAPDHIDYFVFSAHKMYAPFGTGVLVGPRETFAHHPPAYSGGGTIKAVTLDDTIWAELPDKYEAGTPNIIGTVALGAAIKFMQNTNWQNLINHENKLLDYLINQLNKLEEVQLYGQMEQNNTKQQVGVVPFNLEGVHYSLTAAKLAREFGIGVRSGCFCAHPYLHHLLDSSPEEVKKFKEEIKNNNYTNKPGLVRLSLGCYNTQAEIKRLIKAVKSIIQEKKSGANLTENYQFDSTTGKYIPFKQPNYNRFFSL